MKRDWAPRLRLSSAHLLFGVVGLATVTFVGYRFQIGIGIVAFAYFIGIALLSPIGTFFGSVLLSLFGAACLNYFFAPPAFSFRIHGWSDAAFVIAFLTAALVTAALLERARRQTIAAIEVQSALKTVSSNLEDHKETERALRRSEVFLAEAQKLSRTGSFSWTPATGAIQWSDEGYRIFELDRALKPTVEFVLQRCHPDDRTLVRQAIAETSRGEKDFNITHRLLMPDGAVKHVHVLSRPMKDSAGNLEVIGALTDITERIRDQLALKQSEERYRFSFEHMPVALWRIRSDVTLALLQELRGRGVANLNHYLDENPDLVYQAMDGTEIIEANQRTVELFGARNADEILGTVRRIWRNHADNYKSLLEARFNGEAAFKMETDLTTLDGRTIRGLYFYLAIPFTLNAPGESLVGFLDETDRLRTQSRLAAIVSSSDDAIIGKTLDGVITSWNTGATEIFGYEPHEMIGQSITRLIPTELHDEETRILARLRRGERIKNYETVRTRKDGRSIDISLTVSPTLDSSGKVVGASKVARDISANKRAEAELQQVRAELARVVRVTTLGELTSAIAHEVNQPLTGLVSSGNASLRWLAADPPNLDAARRAIERMIADGTRASDVTCRIRNMVTRAPSQKDTLNINDTILEVFGLVRTEVLRNNILLHTELSDDLPPVWGDRIQLQQVILNLFVNAIEAMSTVDHAQRLLLVSSTKDGPSGVLVTVKDSGTGLDEAALSRLFEAFYTTKAHGMGIGLAVSRTIIQAHGGQLSAKPNQPQGAIFQFTLPSKGEQAL
jgi:PAS domain S-box-containing protein